MAPHDFKQVSGDLQTTLNDASEAAEKSVKEVGDFAQKTVANLGAQAAEKISDSLEASRDALDRSRDAAGAAGAQISDALGEAARSGEAALRRGGADIGARVIRQPLEALLLAGAVGYLIGYLLHRGD